jgi:hypothetical protein
LTQFKSYKDSVFSVDDNNFTEHAISLFTFQAKYNQIYKQYLDNLSINISSVTRVEDIPFLPISLFRYHKIKTGNWTEKSVFISSGTTSALGSHHYMEDLEYYDSVSLKIFQQNFGNPEEYIFLALLPSYIERSNSSLVHMVDFFIRKSASSASGFYIGNLENLNLKMTQLLEKGSGKVILWGVTYALMDFASGAAIDMRNNIIIETGGMKGRREELVREEVHRFLIKHMGVATIYSEYGMTELLSQAYSSGNGKFTAPPWMKILIRDINDPFEINNKLKYGGVNIIDLANVHSCAFIETDDLGLLNEDGTFEITGRLDNSDLRGCNLLIN